MSKVFYSNVVGFLTYLIMCTKPDITLTVSVVSRNMANSGTKHQHAIKWILS